MAKDLEKRSKEDPFKPYIVELPFVEGMNPNTTDFSLTYAASARQAASHVVARNNSSTIGLVMSNLDKLPGRAESHAYEVVDNAVYEDTQERVKGAHLFHFIREELKERIEDNWKKQDKVLYNEEIHRKAMQYTDFYLKNKQR